MVQMEREEAEKERKKEEEERKRRREEAKRRTRILEAAFDGDNEELMSVLEEVKKLLFEGSNETRLSNHSDFVGIIPILLENPESQLLCGRDRKIPILTRVVIFSSNSHKRRQNAEFLTLMSRKTEETERVVIKLPKIFDRNCCVRTPEIASQYL